ncbi:MAG: alpha-ribazole phosphatase [Chloroflexi bacterium]|nr:alpha-ribazole phosphatase [Chloroflexota bacterium]
MTRFYLVRHGQTEWNKVERFRGRVDIPLNETGAAQARAVAERLAHEKIAAVFSSPLLRALKTAEPIAQKLGLAVQIADALVDFDFGDWQGLTPDEVAQKYPDLFVQWLTHPESVSIPGGESLEDVRTRVSRLVADLAARFKNQEVVLVTHKVVCKVLLCLALELDNSRYWQIEQDNGAISVFDLELPSRFVVSLVNDTCHLPGSHS